GNQCLLCSEPDWKPGLLEPAADVHQCLSDARPNIRSERYVRRWHHWGGRVIRDADVLGGHHVLLRDFHRPGARIRLDAYRDFDSVIGTEPEPRGLGLYLRGHGKSRCRSRACKPGAAGNRCRNPGSTAALVGEVARLNTGSTGSQITGKRHGERTDEQHSRNKCRRDVDCGSGASLASKREQSRDTPAHRPEPLCSWCLRQTSLEVVARPPVP